MWRRVPNYRQSCLTITNLSLQLIAKCTRRRGRLCSSAWLHSSADLLPACLPASGHDDSFCYLTLSPLSLYTNHADEQKDHKDVLRRCAHTIFHQFSLSRGEAFFSAQTQFSIVHLSPLHPPPNGFCKREWIGVVSVISLRVGCIDNNWVE